MFSGNEFTEIKENFAASENKNISLTRQNKLMEQNHYKLISDLENTKIENCLKIKEINQENEKYKDRNSNNKSQRSEQKIRVVEERSTALSLNAATMMMKKLEKKKRFCF